MDDNEARAILHEHGEDPPKRGRLAPKWHELAEGYRPGAADGDSYDGGTSPEDFGEPVSVAAPPPDTPTLPAERRPRKPRASRPTLRERVTSAKGKPKTKGKPKPRVSLAPLIGHFWSGLGGLAAQIDVPVGRCVQMQAPVAGFIMEDIVKGTVADRALQPLARAEDKGKKAAALFGPALCVAGLEMAQRLPDPQRKAREAILWPMLIQMLILGEEVAGEYAPAMAERIEREGPAREHAEKLASLIFAQPPGTPAEAEPATAAA